MRESDVRRSFIVVIEIIRSYAHSQGHFNGIFHWRSNIHMCTWSVQIVGGDRSWVYSAVLFTALVSERSFEYGAGRLKCWRTIFWCGLRISDCNARFTVGSLTVVVVSLFIIQMSDTVVYPPNCQPITKCRNNAELIKCLKGLKDALSNAESNEEAGQPDRYSKLALLLVQPKLLDNANDDVRVLLACSIASLFRIFAPNSPIGDPATLKNVLLFLVRTLDGLSDASGPNYKYYYFLLEILSVVETLQLALELSDDSLVVLSCLIKTSLGIIEKRKTHDEVTQSILISMCSKLIQGVDQISDQVLDAIFFYLVPPQKLNNQESFRMARSLVQKNAAALGPAIKVVLAQGLTSGALANCKMTGNKCLHVLEEMNAIIPEIVAPLYDLLIPNLQSEDVGRRLSFVKVVGRLLAQTNSRIAEDVPDLWKAYISRYKDIDETVRTECVKQSLDILVNHPELRGQISDAVIQRLHDMNENIRIECVRLVFTLAKRRFEAVSEDLLANTAERIRDKKVRVRHEAIRVLSLLHRYVFTNEFTKSERSSVSIIFKNILNVYYQPFAEDRVLIERLLFSNLIPFKAVASDRMQILIDCVLSLDASAVRVIEEIFNKQSRMRTQLLKINESIASDFSEQESSIMAKKIDFIASFQPDPSKAAVLIRHFIDFLQSDKRTNDLLMEMLSCKQSTRESEGTLVEIIQRMRDKLPNDVSSFNQSILERCCPLTFDSEAVDQLVSKVFAVIQRAVLLPVGSRSDNNAKLLLKLMKIVERNYAVHFMADKPVKMLCKMLELDDQEIVEDVLDVLHDLLMNTKSKVENIPKSTVDAMIDTCVNIAKCGKLRAAKRAVKCLSLLLIEDIDGTAKITDIAEDAISHISIDDPRCSTAMMVLGACAQAFPETFKGRLKKIVSEDVVDIVLNDDINNINSTSLNMPSDELVVEEFDRSSHYSSIIAEMLNSENHGRKCLMKLRALKLITNYLVTMSKSIDDGITHLMLKTVRMLKELVTSHGSLFRSIYSVNDKGALRAVAGCCIIKLAEVPVFAKLIPVDDFLSLGYLIRVCLHWLN
ncbi:hypothetical protein AB6A40_004284 [Gnathostoma spinigerum]|uniref:Uncharacterized protein n=1 Tax=Gnathostoma spinigerum TaxID=75299 RepID=A0ABD6ED59_9BILA